MDVQERNNVFFEAVNEAMQKAWALIKVKNEGYNQVTFVGDYFPHGETDLTYEIGKKIKRIDNSLEAEKKGVVLAESIEDSVLDIINYAAFIYALRKGRT